MTEAEFTALVHRPEGEAKEDPEGYRLRVVLLALLGYGYLASVLAVLLIAFALLLVTVTDTMEPHGLSAEAVAALRQSVAAVPGVRRAYLACKRVRRWPEQPCYVLGFSCTPWWWWPSNRRRAGIQQRLFDTVSFPGETFVLGIDGDNRRFKRELGRVRGARLL